MWSALKTWMKAVAGLLLAWSMVVSGLAAEGEPAKKQLLLLSSAPDGHAAKTHEYRWCLDHFGQLLIERGDLEVVHQQVTSDWDSGLEALKKADGVVLFLSEGAAWISKDPRRQEAFLQAAQQGKGFLVIHWSLGTREAGPISTMLQLIGACHGGPDRKYRVMEGEVKIAAPSHPILHGIKPFKIHDEFYYELKKVDGGQPNTKPIQPLLEVEIDGKPQPIAWSWERKAGEGKPLGRSVGFVGGHFQEAWMHQAYERLLVQSAYWIVHADSTPRTRVTIALTEKESAKKIGGRVYLRGEDGKWHFPKSLSSEGTALPYQVSRGNGSEEMHTTVSPHPFAFRLLPGKYQLLVERGTEYLPLEKTVEIPNGGEDQDLQMELSRWVHMAEQGWYSGDTHIHRQLVDIPNLALAEDVNVTFPLSHWVTTADADAVAGNRIKGDAPAPKAITIDAKHLIYPLNTEYEIFTVRGKAHTLGAFVGIGHQKPLTLVAPPVSKVAEEIHAQGGLVDLEKHSWPWSIAIVPIMKADLFELSNNHCWRTKFAFRDWTIAASDDYMQLEKEPGGLSEQGWIDFGFQTYYALLNCGFRLSPTAGTGQGVHPVPMGFSRVYVKPDGDFSYESWMKGLKAGRSFVTTGPMLDVTVDGRLPGSQWNLAAGESSRLPVKIVATAAHPIDRVELVDQTGNVQTHRPESRPNGRGWWQAQLELEKGVDASGWLAVRVYEKHPEGRPRFAHTAPFYFTKAGSPLLPTLPQIRYLVRRCREEVERNRGVVSAESFEEYQTALAYYQAIESEVLKQAPAKDK